MNAKQLHNFLYENNTLYKESYDNKKEININIMACNSGKDIVVKLSKYNPNANVKGPTGRIKMSWGRNIIVDKDGKMVIYKNGTKL